MSVVTLQTSENNKIDLSKTFSYSLTKKVVPWKIGALGIAKGFVLVLKFQEKDLSWLRGSYCKEYLSPAVSKT